ncbi:MAG: glucose-6-phosphate 1-dehydrogenase, partial [Pseudomonadota bacterium]|nr:glucose-6-phosphate 1-dehydrogenase [Pseudomonadota bacterium]
MTDNITCTDNTEASNIVIFGATGDLTKRKLMPALLKMIECKLVHPQSRIIGVVNKRTQDEWIQLIKTGMEKYAPAGSLDEAKWKSFSSMLHMVPGDLSDATTYSNIANALQSFNGKKNALFYCAIPPQWYPRVTQGLHDVGLTDQKEGYRRIVIEKPFGMDLQSAQELNCALQSVLHESQIYRIDHYLGKESVQNLLVFRFANSIMEPLWNRNYIDHIQISAAETLGIEYRAKYYENSGALRDMIQSHLMQVMTLVAMEPPVEFTADAVRDEKMKVLRAIRRFTPDDIDKVTVAAQYASGNINGEKVPAYVTEQDVSPDSATETFAGVRFYIDN